MPSSDKVPQAHLPGCLHLFEPASNPRIFIAGALDMKCQDPLGISHRRNNVRTILVCIGHLLQLVQILQTSLKIGQTAAQDRLALMDLEKAKEGHTGKKLGVYSRLLGSKIAQRGLQPLISCFGQYVRRLRWLCLDKFPVYGL